MTDDMINPVFDHAAWMARAACHGSDINVFFPTSGITAANAKAACEGCPVRAECLQYAIDNEIHHGVWGGLSERQRMRLRNDARVDGNARGPVRGIHVKRCGTHAAYRRGCHCIPCVEANRQYRRNYMAQRRAEAMPDYAMPSTPFGQQLITTLMEATG